VTELGDWIDQQTKLVEESGATPKNLVLEGPDGRPWATLPVATEGLQQRAEAAQRSLESTMPNGSHSARWVLFDGQLAQFSCLPCVLRGRSQDATAAAKDAQAFARATSVQLANTEHLATLQKNLLDQAFKRLEETQEDRFELKEALSNIVNANQDADFRQKQFEAGERRLDEILKTVAPMFGAAANILAEKFMRWSEEQEKERERAKKRKRRRGLPASAPNDGKNPPPPVDSPGNAAGGKSTARMGSAALGRKRRGGANSKKPARATKKGSVKK